MSSQSLIQLFIILQRTTIYESHIKKRKRKRKPTSTLIQLFILHRTKIYETTSLIRIFLFLPLTQKNKLTRALFQTPYLTKCLDPNNATLTNQNDV